MTGLRLSIALLAAALVGGVVGGWITGVHGQRAAVTETVSPAIPPIGTAPQSAVAAFSPLGEARRDDGKDVSRARKDPAFLRMLILSYLNETDLDKRGALLAILQSVANDDVLRLVPQLLADPARRQDGLALLRAYPMDKSEARSMLLSELQRETNPAQLTQMIEMLTPAVMSTDDAAPVVEHLAMLRRNPDPSVRASSVTQSIQWDKGGNMEDILYTALLDPSAQVRLAAIGAAGVAGVRSERLKAILLDSLGNLNAEERNAALFTLQGFPLTRDEYALYKQVAVASSDGHEGVAHK